MAIGASTAIFSVFDAFVLHPLPYRNPEQLVSITEDYKGSTSPGCSSPTWSWTISAR